MTAIKGTNVAAPVVPFDDADVYPTHEDQYGLGGYRAVADNTARDAISAERRTAGMLVYSIAATTTYQLGSDLTTWTPYTPGAVTPPTPRYDIGFYLAGKPDASQYILELLMVTSVTLVTSLTGSKFAIRVNPTSTMAFSLIRIHSGTPTTIGSISFNTSGVATVTFVSSITFVAGDTLVVQAPTVQDTTGADISFTFVGSI